MCGVLSTLASPYLRYLRAPGDSSILSLSHPAVEYEAGAIPPLQVELDNRDAG